MPRRFEPTPSSASNILKVLKALRSETELSRKDLPARTGLSAGTITAVTSDLLTRGLIVESRTEASGRGRPRVNLSLDVDSVAVVGSRLSDRAELQTSFVDLAGRELHMSSRRIASPRDLNDFVALISVELARAIAEGPVAQSRIVHVGVALPALVDSRSGVVHFMAGFPSDPVPAGQIISDQLHVPVTVENDTHCLIRAEHWFGKAQHWEDFTLINIDYAVTSARYAGGLPEVGVLGFTSELGHTKTHYGPDARSCYCGARGCASTYMSKSGLVLESDYFPKNVPPLDAIDARFAQFLGDAEAGDAKSLKELACAGEHLGRLVANDINANDPGMILILAPNDRYRRFTEASFFAALQGHALPALLRGTQIEFTTRSEGLQAKGIAALALEKTYLSRPSKATLHGKHARGAPTT